MSKDKASDGAMRAARKAAESLLSAQRSVQPLNRWAPNSYVLGDMAKIIHRETVAPLEARNKELKRELVLLREMVKALEYDASEINPLVYTLRAAHIKYREVFPKTEGEN